MNTRNSGLIDEYTKERTNGWIHEWKN